LEKDLSEERQTMAESMGPSELNLDTKASIIAFIAVEGPHWEKVAENFKFES
jgi:hypothetical protein